MFASGPPAAGTDEVRLVRAERQEFAGPAEFLTDPVHRMEMGRYLSDMAGAYGTRLRDDVFDGIAVTADLGHSYGEMAEALIAQTVTDPVDLLVLAFANHDVRPGRATATYLSHVCPGTPMAFAVCDQGPAGAYTALRLVREYLRSGTSRRALLVVVEHAGLPYDAPGVPLPARHAGVALVLEPGPGRRVGPVRQHAGVALSDVDSHLPADRKLVRAPASRPYIGSFWEVGDATDPVTLVGYDERLRYLSLVDVG